MRFNGVALVFALVMHGVVQGNLIEVGDLQFIDQVGNPSNGLRFLDMSFSVGLTAADAVANAQATYADARLATPSEFDDLFMAAGITYPGPLTASDGFTSTFLAAILSSGATYDGGVLRDKLGITSGDATVIWTNPDGELFAGTVDVMRLQGDEVSIAGAGVLPAQAGIGWLVVSETAAIPEPSSFLLVGMAGLATVFLSSRRRRRR